jgi:tRNA U34 5-methylaminomethyl-2-thiouridine-forming methyltransferase MnmC
LSNLTIIETGDGSHSLFNKELDETYHSRHGALQESTHVFIRQGLDRFLDSLTEVFVFEVGFGTGLNALLTWQWAVAHRIKVNYTTTEPFPLPEDIWKNLNYASAIDMKQEYERLHISAWERPQSMSPYFTFTKQKTALQQVTLKVGVYDLIYFDAFAPNKQPHMWTSAVFAQLASAMKPGAILVTYCAKGQVKRDLKSTGFTLETLPGPPGKREMVRAVR